MTPQKVSIPNEIILGAVSRLVSEGHTTVILTKGNSMSPFIRGDRDSVELSAPGDLKVGDIALAQITPGHYVLHRIFRIDGDSITLKGDGNLNGTEHCSKADICAVAIRILRPGHKAVDCSDPAFMRRSTRWRGLPYQVRRYTLAIYRRIKFL